MANLGIEQRLHHYFLAMGAQPSDPILNPPQGLDLRIESERIHIAILDNDSLLDRSKIIASIFDLAALGNSADHIYLAAPRLLGTSIGAEVFRSHGIGLLLFDERRIEEVVPPQRVRQASTAPTTQTSDPGLVHEVATLRSMCNEMERAISSLRDELKTFHELASLRSTPVQQMTPAALAQTPPRFTGSESELPSFFTNNPWLEVLAKRGREDAGTVAA